MICGMNADPDWIVESKSIFGILKDWKVDTQKLKDELRKLRRGKEEEVLSQMLKELEEAYKQGKKKKLTLDEFKLLMSKGLI